MKDESSAAFFVVNSWYFSYFQFQQLKLSDATQGYGDGSYFYPGGNQYIAKGFSQAPHQARRGTPPRFGRFQPDMQPQQQQFNGYSYMSPWFMTAPAGGGNKPSDGIGIFGAPPENGRFDHYNAGQRGFQRRPYRGGSHNYNGYANHNNNNNNSSAPWKFSFKTEEELFCNNTPKPNINLELYDSIPVKQSGPDWTAVDPLTSFNDVQLHKVLVENIERAQYVHPTPVQKYALPIVLAKRDLMACAQTGSGKTAAFLLPILNMMLESAATEEDEATESVRPAFNFCAF